MFNVDYDVKGKIKMPDSDSVKTSATTFLATYFSWICAHANEIQAVIIFLFTVYYLYWKTREARANALKAEKTKD